MRYPTETIMNIIAWAKGRAALAEKLGVSIKTVYAWSSGRNRPSVPMAIRIQKVSKGRFKAHSIRPDVEGL